MCVFMTLLPATKDNDPSGMVTPGLLPVIQRFFLGNNRLLLDVANSGILILTLIEDSEDTIIWL